MKKLDMLIYLILLSAAAALLVLWNSADTDALTAHIYVEGELFESVYLQDSQEMSILTAQGHNVLGLEPDGVRMISADCRSGDCVHMGKITRPGQLIACLPNRVIVHLEGNIEEGDFDAVAG